MTSAQASGTERNPPLQAGAEPRVHYPRRTASGDKKGVPRGFFPRRFTGPPPSRPGPSALEKRHAHQTIVAAAVVAVGTFTAPVAAQDTRAEALREVDKAFGFVPSFFQEYPEHGVAGAWILTRDLEVSQETELSPKVKSLINIAVAAQIPCSYCVFADTQAARAAGATEGEIKEAVAQAALTRHWSTILNGLQIDLDEFKAEFGG